jgi:putative sigma-54 modulation protein
MLSPVLHCTSRQQEGKMEIEFTGRQVVISKKLRTLAQSVLDRVGRLLGRSASAHVVLSTEKHRRIAEITITAKQHTIVGLAEAVEMEKALHDALVKTERQAVRLKDRIKGRKKREGRKKHEADPVKSAATSSRRTSAARKLATGLDEDATRPTNGKTLAIPVTVHSFPVQALIHEPHIQRSSESVALRPMTIEEAVKEAEFRDRDVFLFRDPAGGVKVLHRKRDGRIELIEEP